MRNLHGGLILPKEDSPMAKKRKKLQGTVQKIIKPFSPNQPEKAQIDVHDADHLYRELRIENEVADEHGDKAKLKPGAEVDVIVEADANATLKKPA
jgi:hypothetical protein